MITDDKIRNEKLKQTASNKQQKISALSSGKIEKYYIFDQSRMIEQAIFTYYPLRKALEKQIKATEKNE